jgi:hypothetical protein
MGLFPEVESEIIAKVLGSPQALPVNLQQIARHIGVSAVKQTRHADGFTDFHMPTPVIYLGQTANKPRTRFIFAHELAHVMLRTPQAKDIIERRGEGSLLNDEEKLANRIASSLLIPDSCVDELRQSEFTPRMLEDTARRAKVSVMVLIARLSAAGLDIAMLHWQKGRFSWYVVDRPGAPLFLHGHIQLSRRSRRTIENLSRRESEIIVEGCIAGRNVTIRGRGRRVKEQAFQYIQPSCDVWLKRNEHVDTCHIPSVRNQHNDSELIARSGSARGSSRANPRIPASPW